MSDVRRGCNGYLLVENGADKFHFFFLNNFFVQENHHQLSKRRKK